MPIQGRNRSFGLPQEEPIRSSVDHSGWDNDHFFHDLPDAPGKAPYRLDLAEVLATTEINKIVDTGEITFHATGDTGNIRGRFQEEVAYILGTDADQSNVKFFYHLGDVVYDYGEDREYPGQFYDIYREYNYPIFAIPGNHDGARYNSSPDSLDGFMKNFCSQKPQMPPAIERTGRYYGRDTMTQPHCYWTLRTPHCTIIGLYTNVPSGGNVRAPQDAWFSTELAAAPADKPLIVAMHHPVHSIAVGSHAGSIAMDKLFIDACTKAKRIPELVLCGHVHNYQRFETTVLGKQCQFVVAGMGGHAKDKLKAQLPNNTKIQHSYPVTLRYSTDKHIGFVRIKVKSRKIRCDFIAVDEQRGSRSAEVNAIKKPLDSFVISHQ